MSFRLLVLISWLCPLTLACSGKIILGELEDKVIPPTPDATTTCEDALIPDAQWAEALQEDQRDSSAGWDATDDELTFEDRDAQAEYDAPPDVPPPVCPSLPGPTMKGLPGGYCIDTTEVTRKQYADWLATNPSLTSQIAVCQGNEMFSNDEPFCLGNMDNIVEPRDDNPQGCVDWCDAYAYCTGVGKRLCGRIGGGKLLPAESQVATASEWYNACSSGGGNQYPYGSTYDDAACVHQGTVDHTEPVGNHPACQSSVPGYEGVFDLSGNVAEWEDACFTETGMSDRCGVRGGQSSASPWALRCGSHGADLDSVGRSVFFSNLGFRCCWP